MITTANENYSVLDLFSGAGGLTEGFNQTGNFNMISHLEMNIHASKTLETRMLYYSLIEKGEENIYREYMEGFGMPGSRELFIEKCRNLGIKDTGIINAAISLENRDELAGNIKTNMKNSGVKKIDLIIGGPPCQAYSMLRRWKHTQDEEFLDSRLYLYQHYIHYLRKFRPRIFVFENVPGLKSVNSGKFLEDIQKSMNSEGYRVAMNILDAADFNVIQHRKRIIFIGWQKSEKFDPPEFNSHPANASIKDLIMEDLPILEAGTGNQIQEYRAGSNKYLRESGIRSENQDILLHHVARPHCERDLQIYKLAIGAMNEGRRIKYTDLPEELQTHHNKNSFLDRFKVVNQNELSHSIVAHISRDGHYYIHPDINHPRSLSVREAARIQSFPDNYIFEGPRGPQFVQIGNAVPPLMAKGIAKKILEMLN